MQTEKDKSVAQVTNQLEKYKQMDQPVTQVYKANKNAKYLYELQDRLLQKDLRRSTGNPRLTKSTHIYIYIYIYIYVYISET